MTMRQLMQKPIAVLILCALGSTAAFAQGPRQTRGSSAGGSSRYSRPRIPAYQRPAISPYINLLGGSGRSLTSEYFTRVRPQVEFRGSYNQLGRDLRGVQRQVQQQGRQIQSMASEIGPTGHSTAFLNYGNYFPKGR